MLESSRGIAILPVLWLCVVIRVISMSGRIWSCWLSLRMICCLSVISVLRRMAMSDYVRMLELRLKRQEDSLNSTRRELKEARELAALRAEKADKESGQTRIPDRAK